MWRLALLAAIGCGKQINPAWCAEPGHSDPACIELTDARMTDAHATDAGMTDGEITSCSGDACPSDTALYASPTGAGTACTSDAKCTLATALDRLRDERQVIVLDPVIYSGAVALTHSVQIVGNGATLQAGPSGAAVTVINDIIAELSDLTITGATGAGGIACTAGTLRAHHLKVHGNDVGITSGCALTLDSSVITANRSGALAITAGSIDIRNNFIVGNGNPMLNRSANVIIAAGVTGAFSFNTVAYNDAKPNSTSGVLCSSAALVVNGNLITNNTEKGAFGQPQVSGACDFTKSYTVAGGNNDVHWVDISALDFHLTADSTVALDSPAISCDGEVDFDRDPRPQNGRCDFGADERKP
jgi:hypothetical protein